MNAENRSGQMDQGQQQTQQQASKRRGGANPAQNLSREDRVRGGKRSSQIQQRDERGHFAGRTQESGGRRQGST